VSVGTHASIGVGVSTLLDRSFSTTLTSGQRLGPDSVTFKENVRSLGAINDIRLGGSWAFSGQFAIGLGAHVFTGENRMTLERVFPDTQAIGTLTDSVTLSFSGTGLSAGALWRPSRVVALAFSGRVGGTIHSHRNDSTITTASVPNRFGGSVRF